MRHLILFWGFLVLTIVFVAGCSEEIPPGETAAGPHAVVKAPVMTVKTETQPVIYEAVGSVEAKTGATIAAKVMGEIKKITVNEGNYVKKGDLLIVIEDRQVLAQLNQSKAGLSEARQAANAARSAFESASASAKLAETTYARYKALMESNSVSRQEFDEVESRYHQAKAGLSQAASMRDAAAEKVAQATAAVAAAESAWHDTSITAPYDGRITTKMAQAGDMASPGMPLLNIEETGALEARVFVPETDIANINVGDTVAVDIPSVKKTFQAKIVTIDPAANTSSRSFQIKVALPEISGLHTGLFAKVMIPVGTHGMILIPSGSIVYKGQLTGVFLLDQKNIARFYLIRTGRTFGDQKEVLSGLEDGDRLVAKINRTISDGVRVEKN